MMGMIKIIWVFRLSVGESKERVSIHKCAWRVWKSATPMQLKGHFQMHLNF